MKRREVVSKTIAVVLVFLILSSYSVTEVLAASGRTANFHFQVIDSEGNHITGCRPIILKKRVKVDDHWKWKRVGSFGDGDSKRVNTRRLVFLLKTSNVGWCEGYEFDSWEVTGSGILETRELSNNRLKLKLSDGASVTVTLHLRAVRTVRIVVSPPGSGNVRPLGRGIHHIAEGSQLNMEPLPNAGWRFDHWEVNGEVVKAKSLRVKVTGNIEIKVHFTKVEEVKSSFPEVGARTSSPQTTVRKCAVEPKSLPYRGNYADVGVSKDLLGAFQGRAPPHQKEGVLVLGGGKGEPQPWGWLGVELAEDHVKTDSGTFTTAKGREYGILYFDCGANNLIATGTSPLGTRAALMWLLNHPFEASGKLLVVVEWVDANYDHQVQDEEISAVHEVP